MQEEYKVALENEDYTSFGRTGISIVSFMSEDINYLELVDRLRLSLQTVG